MVQDIDELGHKLIHCIISSIRLKKFAVFEVKVYKTFINEFLPSFADWTKNKTYMLKSFKHCKYFQRGRVEDVVVSDECRGKQLGKL